MSRLSISVAGLAACALAGTSSAQWVSFSNQTSTRLVAASGIGSADPEEKDFAWGDFDHDGDIDLAVARKTPATSIGPRRNVLFMNQGIAEGQAQNFVLVDRTTTYAVAADDGGQGFLDLTDDRDIIAIDVNNDGWLDLVTATTYGNALPKTRSHPRVYINLGEGKTGWLGFKYEQARIPTLAGAPNFCAVGGGDITGDKAPDLYFVDYDSLTTSPFDDRVLINDGNGYFTDQSAARFTTGMLTSSFGSAANILDLNNDGKLDVLKNENGPATAHYNAGAGFFTVTQVVYSGASYFASAADLNNDGRMDVVVSDDGTDRYLLNNGNGGGSGPSTFANLSFPASSSGFGSSSRYADLNKDGFLDVMIADVDVDVPGCGGQMRIFRNLGNLPNVTLADQGYGIPNASLTGTYDQAPINLNYNEFDPDMPGSDTWPDLVIGRCAGISVWMNNPPSGLIFTYPQGLPGFVPSGSPHSFQVQVASVGAGAPLAASGILHYSLNGGDYVHIPMTVVSGNLYEATLPAANCTDIFRFYVSAQKTGAVTFNDPSNAPTGFYSAVSAVGTEITIHDTLEGDTSAWTVTNHASLTGGGAWVVADPVGTLNAAAQAAPEVDAAAGDDINAFVTGNGDVGGAASLADVDNGPTWLVSPIYDLAGTDATMSYSRWLYCEDAGTADADFLFTEVSNNGGTSWVPVHNTGGTGSTWESVNFRVGQYVTPTDQIRFRFWTSDSPNNSVTEAGIDNLTLEELICTLPPVCPTDLNGNGTTDVDDLLLLINAWGTNGPADLDLSGVVDVDDLLILINSWGDC